MHHKCYPGYGVLLRKLHKSVQSLAKKIGVIKTTFKHVSFTECFITLADKETFQIN